MNIVLFDGLCNMCSKTVLFLIKFDKKNNLHFAAQQTNAGIKIMNQYLVKQDSRSVIFIKENLVYYKSDAIIEITKLLSGWPRIAILAIIFPKFLKIGFMIWLPKTGIKFLENNQRVLFHLKQTNINLSNNFLSFV